MNLKKFLFVCSVLVPICMECFILVKSNIKSFFIGLTHLSTSLVDTVSRPSSKEDFAAQLHQAASTCQLYQAVSQLQRPASLENTPPREGHSQWLREDCKWVAICPISETDNSNEHMCFRYPH